MEENKLQQLIEVEVKKQMDFTSKKVTDTPGDALEVVPRKYVTRYATTALRPRTSVLGEFYYDTTVGKPAWWNGTNYQDAAGNVV